jgi:transcriptional regulator GlxA family with amidase domain
MSRRLIASRRHLVASLLLPEVSLFELAVPCEVFGVDRSDLVEPWYRHIVCAVDDGEARGESGLRLTTHYRLDDLRRADTIIVPAWPVSLGLEPPDHLLDALRRAHRRGARLVSLCTGAFVLAAAGVLDGRSATTHWMAADELAQPNVCWRPPVNLWSGSPHSADSVRRARYVPSSIATWRHRHRPIDAPSGAPKRAERPTPD